MNDEPAPQTGSRYEQFNLAAQMIDRISSRLGGAAASAGQLAQIRSALQKVQIQLTAGFAEIEAAQERETRAWAERQRAQPVEEGGSRRSFMLRLVGCTIDDLMNKGRLPREILRGLDEYIEKQIGQPLYDTLNAEAKSLHDAIPKNDDGTIDWERVMGYAPTKRLVIMLLYRLCLRFLNFERAAFTMQTIIQNNLGPGRSFTREHFAALFPRLIDPLREEASTEAGREYLEFMLGVTAIDIIVEVGASFDAWMRDS